jgi:hypothetical protein
MEVITMPGFDGTGPRGLGAFTGRGMGFCVAKIDSNNKEVRSSLRKGVFDMPRGDGTGPMGLGPMTGRGAGLCAGYSMPGYMNPVSGRGYFGMGRGFFGRGGGRGRRNWFYATGLPGWQRASMGFPAFGGTYPYAPEMNPKEEADILKGEADFLKKQLETIQGRIEMLEKNQAEKSE